MGERQNHHGELLGCLQNLVPPYLDALIRKLLSLLQNGQKVVQEGALTAMASVADCAKDSFAKYYTEVSPFGYMYMP